VKGEQNMHALQEIELVELERIEGGLVPLVVAVGLWGLSAGVGFTLGAMWDQI